MRTLLLLPFLFFGYSCQSQIKSTDDKRVGGPCEGCEALYEYGDKELKNKDTIIGFEEYKPQLLVKGTVYDLDGSTPAEDVILYFYHTNRNGEYESTFTSKGWETRHGKFRTWIKTGKDGKYELYTFRPGAYPQRSEPEHIHITVKQPGYSEYYISDIVFDDDPLLTESKRKYLNERAGKGLVVPEWNGKLWVINRDIYLGKNIPGFDDEE